MEATMTSVGVSGSELAKNSACPCHFGRKSAAPVTLGNEESLKMVRRVDERSFASSYKDADFVTPNEPRNDALGPSWVSGRLTCSPDGEITGVRPVVGRYSITRHGQNEWMTRDKTVFQDLNDKILNSRSTRREAKSSVIGACVRLEEVESATTRRLAARACEIREWKRNLARAIESIDGEMQLLEVEGRRVRSTLSVLSVPESIAGEHLEIRATRLDSEFVRDGVEEQLVEEVALCYEIRETLVRVREEIEMRLAELRNAKTQMEGDWSGKCEAYALESANVLLTTKSPLIMWKAGAARIASGQSTTGSYDNYTREILNNGETMRRESVKLRSTLSNIYEDSVKRLREQAASADIVLTRQIDLTEQCVRGLENDLLTCLRELASMDKAIEELRRSAVTLDREMKLTQTRLDNRLQRSAVEDCRDAAQLALLNQVKAISERGAALRADLTRAEEAQRELVKLRDRLEKEVMAKRKSLYVDKQRGAWLRSMYPSVSDLSGYRDIPGDPRF